MGFRNGAWATVWSVEPSPTGSSTKVRISTSKKNREGEYEQDFSGFCTFVGDAHKQVASLSEKDRIRLGGCEVTTRYDKEKGREYINYVVYTINPEDDSERGENPQPTPKKKTAKQTTAKQTAFGNIEDIIDDDDAPF